jgi:tRNA pseudouridine55 synthase
VDGVLLLDKPAGLSSNAALQRAKRLYNADKAGHTGTLDPLASGLLPICFGDATKFAQSLLDARKAYLATMYFGAATSTGDAEGEIVATSDTAVPRDAFERILQRFVGAIMQVPPCYSALKYKGRNYYDYARAGEAIPRVPRPAVIHSLDLVGWDFPCARLHISCGKGTYIRTLVEDLAAAGQSCAHVTALRRTGAGSFALESAVTLDVLAALTEAERDALLLPVESPLAEMDRVDVDAAGVRALMQGRDGAAPLSAGGRYRCFGPGDAFIGVVEVGAGRMRPVRLVRAS